MNHVALQCAPDARFDTVQATRYCMGLYNASIFARVYAKKWNGFMHK